MERISYEDTVKFHGHSCPGLAMGYKMTLAALEFLDVQRPKDEELVAIVENDACGVDAVQCLSGCTFGKGNLIFKDYGKMVYIFYDRNRSKAVRISRKAKEKARFKALNREETIDFILNSKSEQLFLLEKVKLAAPDFANFYQTVICEECGESVTENRTHNYQGKTLCIPCYQKKEQKWINAR